MLKFKNSILVLLLFLNVFFTNIYSANEEINEVNNEEEVNVQIEEIGGKDIIKDVNHVHHLTLQDRQKVESVINRIEEQKEKLVKLINSTVFPSNFSSSCNFIKQSVYDLPVTFSQVLLSGIITLSTLGIFREADLNNIKQNFQNCDCNHGVDCIHRRQIINTLSQPSFLGITIIAFIISNLILKFSSKVFVTNKKEEKIKQLKKIIIMIDQYKNSLESLLKSS